jgi:adenosylcobinamide kinase/adenosylcobinamide-phosphate guanylyltransferase
MRELILGGQRSGKSRTAEERARDWLAASPHHEALLVATALPGDDEMRERIAHHQASRRERVPGLHTLEEPQALAEAIEREGRNPRRLVIVDCLTLWLTNLLMPISGTPMAELAWQHECARLALALRGAQGPLVLVSNEIGLGLSPMSREARRFVDELGRLHQAVAAQCERVTLMVAGCALAVKTPGALHA